eukprot:356678-Chlamydomonas_euryale.AAC.2
MEHWLVKRRGECTKNGNLSEQKQTCQVVCREVAESSSLPPSLPNTVPCRPYLQVLQTRVVARTNQVLLRHPVQVNRGFQQLLKLCQVLGVVCPRQRLGVAARREAAAKDKGGA